MSEFHDTPKLAGKCPHCKALFEYAVPVAMCDHRLIEEQKELFRVIAHLKQKLEAAQKSRDTMREALLCWRATVNFFFRTRGEFTLADRLTDAALDQ